MSSRLSSLAPDHHLSLGSLKQALASVDAAPPAYHDAQEDLPKYSGPGQTPAVPPEKVMEIILNVVSSPACKSALRKSIDDLGESTFSIEVSFTNVARGFIDALKVTSTEDQRKSIREFQADWEQHRKTYLDLLWQSRVVAGHARSIADDFITNFLDFLRDESVSLDDKKEEIEGYREKLKEDMQGSKNLAQGFVDLQTSITEFRKKVTDFSRKRDQIEQQIKTLIGDIQKTSEEIKKLTSQMSADADASLALGSVSAGASAISTISPSFWSRTVSKVKNLVGKDVKEDPKNVEEQAKIKEAKLEEQRAELERLQVALPGMQKVYTILHPLQSDMALIHKKLGTFSQIWSFIHADLGKIESDLHMAGKTKAKSLFNKRLLTIEQIYSALCYALYEYETRVHTQPAPASDKSACR